MRVYHGTRNVFDQFRKSHRDLGIHFGTYKQAATNQFSGRYASSGGLIIPVYLRVLNPLRMNDFFKPGKEGVESAVNALWGKEIISRVEAYELIKLSKSTRVEDRCMSNIEKTFRMIEAAIVKAGYDGIVYLNKWETSGYVPAVAEDFIVRRNRYQGGTGYWVSSNHPAANKNWPYGGGETPAKALADALERTNKGRSGGWPIHEDSYAVFEPSQIRFAITEGVQSRTGESMNNEFETPPARERMRG